jgi:hypothetical protein
MNRIKGVWTLYRFETVNDDLVKTRVEEISEVCDYDDVFGDELYDRMSENIEGFDADDYDFDGDGDSIAVMPKREGMPEYTWMFKAEG